MTFSTMTLLLWVRIIIECVWACLRAVPALIFQLFSTREEKDLNGKVALVTGAARNLGREIALELSRYGCTVICVDVNAEGIKRTAQDVVKLGGRAREYACDLTDSKAVAELVIKAGPVDILVNNAGYICLDSLLEAPEAAINTVVKVNITSHFLMLRAFLPGMIQRDSGHIVGIASCAGLIGLPYAPYYSCSKFAVVGLMTTLAEEARLQGGSNIKISCVCPYFIRTIEEIDTDIDSRLPPIETVDAAKDIVRGIRQELPMFTVPRYFENLLYLQGLFPRIFREQIRNVIHFKVKRRNIQKSVTKGNI